MSDQKQLTTLFHSVFSIQYHLVMVTKYRKKCLTLEMHEYLKAQAARLLEGWECELLAMNGEPDHVHLLLSTTPKVQPSKLVNMLKTATSRLMRNRYSAHLSQYYWKPVLWSRSYCLISCEGAPLSVIRQYIEQQARFE